MGDLVQRAKDAERLKAARRRVDRARNFPHNTCPASRHLHMLADALAKGKMPYMLTEEPQHCAEDIYAVLASLWKARTKENNAKARKALAGSGRDG